jgi:Domain of unknown function (DUF4350)
MSRGWKIALGLLAGVIVLNLGLAALRSATGGTPGGPTSSSYATASDGAAAFASLLARAGHDVVRERVAPHRVALDPGDTVVVLDPPFVLPQDAIALRRFVRRGGRLIASSDGSSWLGRVVSRPPAWGAHAVTVARPLVPIAELQGVRRIEPAGNGAWLRAGSSIPVLGDRQGSILAVAALGRGRALLLADSSPLQNAYLGKADNARLASSLAGAPSRRVVFFETYHGYGRGTGFGAIPARWRLAFLLAGLAALVFMFARVRRLGPPELAARPFAPSRREYVDALAATLARTRDRGEALAPLRREIRDRITRRSGLPPDAPDADVGAAAARFGLASDEIQSLLRSEPPFDELAIGRAFARTAPERRPQ